MNKLISSVMGVLMIGASQYAAAEYAYSYTPNVISFDSSCPSLDYCEPYTNHVTPLPIVVFFKEELEANKSYGIDDMLGFGGFWVTGYYRLNLSNNSGIREFEVTTDSEGKISQWNVLDYQRPYFFKTTTNLDEYSIDYFSFIGYGSTPNVSTWEKSFALPYDFGTSVVPEPESYAMMLVGLAGIGFSARRKKHYSKDI